MINNARVDIRHMRAFVAVAETLHFKKAAEALFITQPALSRLIKGLEAEIGAALFSRTTRQVALTDAGQLLLAECQLAFEHINRGIRLARRAAAGDVGAISIAYNDFSINSFLPRFLEHFKDAHPEIRLELTYMPSHVQLEAIRNAQIDVGFLFGPLEEPGIETLRLELERTVVILPRKHRLSHRKSVRPEELAEEKFIIGSESGWKSFRSFVFDLCLRAGFVPQVVQEATSSTGILALVAADMGISLYSEAVKNFARKDIAIVPLASKHAVIETVAAWNRAYQRPSFLLFRDALRRDLLGRELTVKG